MAEPVVITPPTTRRRPAVLKAWWLLERAALRSQAQYRSNLFVGFLGGFTFQGIHVAFMALLLNQFGVIDGWGFREIGLLIGLRLAAHAVYVLPFQPVTALTTLVHSGEFDLLLLRPVNTFVQLITRRFHIMAVGDGLLGGVILAVFAVQAPTTWTAAKVGYLLLAVMGGGLVEAAIQIAISALAFRLTTVQSINYFADGIVTTFGIYPLTIFGPRGLIGLCFVFPLGFIAYLPTAALLGRVGEVPLPDWVVWGSPAVGWALFAIAVWFLGRMSRLYQSPGA